MLEAGTAIVVACLPTMKFIFNENTGQRFWESIKSLLSLPPGLSRGSWFSIRSAAKSRHSEGSSVEHIVREERRPSVESYAMRDLEAISCEKPQTGTIMLQKIFQQQETIASGTFDIQAAPA